LALYRPTKYTSAALLQLLRVRFFGLRFPLGSLFWGMRTSKAHSADVMRLSFSEVLGAQRSTAVSTNTDGRPSVTSQGAYKTVHQNALIFGALFPRFGWSSTAPRL
jgi:hypothetical protein